MHYSRICLPIALLFSVTAFGRDLSPEAVDAQFKEFVSGSYEPKGTIFSPSNKERDNFNQLWKDQQWELLAKAIIRSKPYHSDLIWFYLGEAASGLNNGTVAGEYYRKAVTDANSTNGNARCAAIKVFNIDNCSGLQFPADAEAKLASGSTSPSGAGALALPGMSGSGQSAVKSNDWRISDISLQDSAQVAEQKIKSAYPKIQSRAESRPKLQIGASKVDLPVIPLGTRYVAGHAELSPSTGKIAVAGMKELGNQSIYFDVIYGLNDSKRILLVKRNQLFARAGNFEESPTSDTMKKSLIEKYGQPTQMRINEERDVDFFSTKPAEKYNSVTMTWMAGNTAEKNCIALGQEMLPEGIPHDGTVNRLKQMGGNCGTMLQYRFTVFPGDRVGSASAIMFDGDTIIDDFDLYVRNAARNARDQSQKDIEKRANNKPAL